MNTRAWIEKPEFVAQIGAALAGGAGYAAGKIGFSEQNWLYYPIFRAAQPGLRQRRTYEALRKFHCERQAGVFPADKAFLDAFTAWHAGHVAQLDCLGLFGAAQESRIVAHYGLPAHLIGYETLRPDRSSPGRAGPCYLPFFAGRRLLIVSSFADLLARRATPAVFEAVWANIGKRWFAPASVAALEFPYCYPGSDRGGFATCIDLFDDIARRMAAIEFDVALIGAGALGIPIAAQAKKLGRVGLSLGGELQVLFGVSGRRWREDPLWKSRYFNDAWIDLPERYHPPDKGRIADGGAYW